MSSRGKVLLTWVTGYLGSPTAEQPLEKIMKLTAESLIRYGIIK